MFSIPAIWTALKLWQGWKRIGAGLQWLLAHPMAALALGLAVWGVIEARAAAKWQRQASKIAATLNNERAAAQAAKLAAEQKYRSRAHDADQNHAQLAAQGDARLPAYIADHRMQPAQAHSAGAAQGGGAAISASPAPGPIVAPLTISEADLRICDANYTYARAAFDWAAGLNKGQ